MRRDRKAEERVREPRSIRDVLKRLVNDFGDGGLLYLLHQHWEQAVGLTVAEHCKPQKIVDGHLVVYVDHPGWATEIKYLEYELLENLAQIDPELHFEGVKVHVKGIQDS
tara:strand:+ start:2848 stop:3177 length:330 start_codon:yes stop_codon:yes gene_type:complete